MGCMAVKIPGCSDTLNDSDLEFESLGKLKDLYKQVLIPYKIRDNVHPTITMSRVSLVPLPIPESQLHIKDFPVFSFTTDQLISCSKQILHSFNLDPYKLESFLHLISKNYFPNLPFHNFRHSFSVLQMIFVIAERNQGLDNFISRQDYLYILLAGLGHDILHPGLNNSYLISTKHELAIKYNNKSVLENHHAAITMELLKFSNLLGEVDLTYLREVVVSAILATDLSRHSIVDSEFKQAVSCYDKSKKHHRISFSSYLVHCADLGNQTLEFSIASNWSLKIIQEFNQQVACEELSGITVSDFMRIGNDIDKIKKSQSGFIEAVVYPLWKELFDTVDHLDDFKSDLIKNKKIWENLKDFESDIQPQIFF